MAELDKPIAWVTLTTCRTLAEADLLATELRAAQIPAFVPDESLIQNSGGIMDIGGFIRVQVHSRDYETARQLLSAAQE
jgi:hypothetical protein